jgi:hypothetical protein
MGYLKITKPPNDEIVSQAIAQVTDLDPNKKIFFRFTELTQEEYEEAHAESLRKFGPPDITNVEIQKNKLN